METTDAVKRLSALAQDARLEVFRLLVKAGPEGLPAGEIARKLDTPPNTMSAQLLLLSNAGLIRARRDGRIGLSLEIREDFELCRGGENNEFLDLDLRQIDAFVLLGLLLQLDDPAQQIVGAFRVRVSGQLVVIVAPDLERQGAVGLCHVDDQIADAALQIAKLVRIGLRLVILHAEGVSGDTDKRECQNGGDAGGLEHVPSLRSL